MVYPTIEATATSQSGADVTTHTVTLPSGIAAGDLVIVFVTIDSNPAAHPVYSNPITTWPTGWVVTETFGQGAPAGSRPKVACWYRLATGGEGTTVTFTTDEAQRSVHCAYRIRKYKTHCAAPLVFGGPIGVAKACLWLSMTGWDDGTLNGTYSGSGYGSPVSSVDGVSTGVGLLSLSKSETRSSDSGAAVTVATSFVGGFTLGVLPDETDAAEPSTSSMKAVTWPVAKQNSGAFSPHYWERPPSGGSLAPDPDYPRIVVSEAVKVTSVGGRNVLTTDRAGGEPAVDSGVWLMELGPDGVAPGSPTAGNSGTPWGGWWNAAAGRIVVDYQFDAASWDEGVFAILAAPYTGWSVATPELEMPIDPGSTLYPVGARRSVATLLLEYETFEGNAAIDAWTLRRSEWVGKRVRFTTRWKTGTITGPGVADVAEDGFLRLSIMDLDTTVTTEIYNIQGIALIVAYGHETAGMPGPNYLNGIAFGYYGLAGHLERAVIESPTISIVPWSLVVAGVDRTDKIKKGTLRGDWTRGGFGTASFETFDVTVGATAYRPALDQEVVFTWHGAVIYRGFITDVADAPLGGVRSGTGIAVKCTDYSSLLDRVTVTKDYTGGVAPILWSMPAGSATDVTVPPGMIPIRMHWPHGWVTGDTVRISDHFSTPPDSAINGDYTITVPPNPTADYWIGATFFITAPARTATGGGGTARKTWTLKALVVDITATYLTPNYGITLDPTMATGPVLEPAEFTGSSVTDVLKALETATGYVWRVLPTKELQVFTLGTKVAPYALDGSNTNTAIQWQQSRRQFTNRVTVIAGGTQKVVATESFAHTGTGAAEYVVGYPASQDINEIYPNQVIADGVAVAVVGFGPAQLPAPCWYWDYRDGGGARTPAKLVQMAGATNFAAGTVITVTYTRQYPVRVMVENATDVQPPPVGRGPWETVYEYPNVTDMGQALTIAEQTLSQSYASPRELQAGTEQGYAYPADTMTLTFPDRIVSGSWVIESVAWSFRNPFRMFFEFKFIEGAALLPTWIDDFQELLTGGGGGSVTTVSTPGSVGGGGGGGGGGSTDLEYLGGYAPGTYSDGDIVIGPDGIAYICVKTTSTAPEPWSGVGFSPRAVAAGGPVSVFLGGSRQFAAEPNPSAWVGVPDYVRFHSVADYTGNLYVEVWARSAGVGATARLFNLTDSLPVVATSMVTSTSPVSVTLPVTVLANKAYRLEVLNSVDGEAVFAIGTLGD